MQEISINNRKIGQKHPPYVIAEMSANHNSDINNAYKIIDMAKASGTDAVKLATYTPDTLTIDSDLPDFQLTEGLWAGQTLFELYKGACMPWEWHQPLFDYAKKVGITIFSSPFDNTAVDLLEELNTPVYKIASFEMTDLPLVRYVAQTKKPMIISTGMANLEEITEVVKVAKENGCTDLILLHCISSYPAPAEQSNLKTIPDLAERFGLITGLSDHTMGTTVATTSVALGACVIEKHFTLSRAEKGPDSEFSLEPQELKQLCIDTKIAWQSLGQAGYARKKKKKDNVKFRRSLYFVKDIEAGEIITKEHVKSIRPGYGIAPKYIQTVIGKKVMYPVQRGMPVIVEMIE